MPNWHLTDLCHSCAWSSWELSPVRCKSVLCSLHPRSTIRSARSSISYSSLFYPVPRKQTMVWNHRRWLNFLCFVAAQGSWWWMGCLKKLGCCRLMNISFMLMSLNSITIRMAIRMSQVSCQHPVQTWACPLALYKRACSSVDLAFEPPYFSFRRLTPSSWTQIAHLW